MKTKEFTPSNGFINSIVIFSLILLINGCSKEDTGPGVTTVDIKSFDPASPATLYYHLGSFFPANDRVEVNFDYSVVQPEGVKIKIEPRSSTATKYTAMNTSLPLYQGSGNSNQMISVTSEEPSVVVDKLVITILNADQSEIISERTVDVNFVFETAVNDIEITEISPVSPAILGFSGTGTNDNVSITYDYTISSPHGARIWIIPLTNGTRSPRSEYTLSGIFTGTGTNTVEITVNQGAEEVKIDQFEIVITNPDQSTTLTKRTIDVDYTFSD